MNIGYQVENLIMMNKVHQRYDGDLIMSPKIFLQNASFVWEVLDSNTWILRAFGWIVFKCGDLNTRLLLSSLLCAHACKHIKTKFENSIP